MKLEEEDSYFVFHKAWAALTFSWAVCNVKGGLWCAILAFQIYNMGC